MFDPTRLLFLEPTAARLSEPVLDHYTTRMAAAFRKAVPLGEENLGFHTCACGARSASHDYTLANGEQTNSLCIHYLALHRAEVPEAQLARVRALPDEHATATDDELFGPRIDGVRRVAAPLGFWNVLRGWFR